MSIQFSRNTISYILPEFDRLNLFISTTIFSNFTVPFRRTKEYSIWKEFSCTEETCGQKIVISTSLLISFTKITIERNTIYFFRITQSWHYWHFRTTSDMNNLQTVYNHKNSNTSLDMLRVHWIKNDVTETISNLFSNLSNRNANFVYFEKTLLGSEDLTPFTTETAWKLNTVLWNVDYRQK